MKTKLFIVVILLVAFFTLLPQPEQTPTANFSKDSNDLSSLNRNFIIRNVRLYDGNILHNKTDIEKNR
jgi:hypothetical protein